MSTVRRRSERLQSVQIVKEAAKHSPPLPESFVETPVRRIVNTQKKRADAKRKAASGNLQVQKARVADVVKSAAGGSSKKEGKVKAALKKRKHSPVTKISAVNAEERSSKKVKTNTETQTKSKTLVKKVKTEKKESKPNQSGADAVVKTETAKTKKSVSKKSSKTIKVQDNVKEEGENVEVMATKVLKVSKKKAAEQLRLLGLPPREAVGRKWLGAHVSSAGGVHNAFANCKEIRGNAFALFLKSQRKWESPPLSQDVVKAFKEAREKTSIQQILPHGSYLINLANPDQEKREKALEALVDDVSRCDKLGIELYNLHPGSSVGGCSREDAIANIADGVNRCHKVTKNVVIVLENMAVTGKNVIGGKFADLGAIIAKVENKKRVGVCLDTCHAFAAGYDFRTKESYEETLAELDRDIGFKYLKGVHLNDSKGVLGCGLDRHENIGKGWLSRAPQGQDEADKENAEDGREEEELDEEVELASTKKPTKKGKSGKGDGKTKAPPKTKKLRPPEGEISHNVWKFLMNDERFNDIPIILETPNGAEDPALWAAEIDFLYGLVEKS